jgi:hypothetical protein
MKSKLTFQKWFDLVVPDESVAAAAEILKTGSFPVRLIPCPDPSTCEDGSSPSRKHPHPAFHIHIEDFKAIALHRQSETLWFLPPLNASLANPLAGELPSYLALASDETAVPPHQRHQDMGAYEVDQTVVLVLKAHTLTEALMRIAARDLTNEKVGGFALAHLEYIKIYVEPFGYLDLSLLPEPFAKYYKNLNKWNPVDWNSKLLRTCGVPLWDSSLHR